LNTARKRPPMRVKRVTTKSPALRGHDLGEKSGHSLIRGASSVRIEHALMRERIVPA
jgi:hypothetical protein